MIKRVIISALIILCLYTVGVFSFRILDLSREYEMQDNFNVIEANQLEDYLLASGNGTVFYLLFFSNDSNDAIYLRENILPTLHSEKAVDVYQTVSIVDFSNVDLLERSDLLTEKWHTDIPSFVCMHIENNEIITDSFLAYDSTKPLKASDVAAWLKENGIYFAS